MGISPTWRSLLFSFTLTSILLGREHPVRRRTIQPRYFFEITRPEGIGAFASACQTDGPLPLPRIHHTHLAVIPTRKLDISTTPHLHHDPRIKATMAQTMQKIRRSKVSQVVDKLAVESEPGLTNTQLMLTNHDLKPGRVNFLRYWLLHSDLPQLNLSDDNGAPGISLVSGLPIPSTSYVIPNPQIPES